MKRLTHVLLMAACAAAPLALLAAGPAHAQTVMRPSANVTLSIGRGQLITVPGNMADVYVADDKIADVHIKSANQLYLLGKSGGETTVYASNAAGRVVWSANVRVGSNIESVDQMLRLAMPDARITVSTIGSNTFLLTGTISSPDDASEAQRLVAAFVGGGKGGAAGADSGPNIISRLRMATPLQVNLQVRIAEVSRSLVRQIGNNLVTRSTGDGFQFGLQRGAAQGTIGPINTAGLPQLDASSLYGLPKGTLSLPFNPQTGQFITGGTQYNFAGNSAGQTAVNLAGHWAGLDILSTLNLGETVGLVTTLSSPNLTALSGETADFLAGGEFPIPISQGLGATTVEYKKFGVSLAYSPTVLADGRISMRVRPEVSELSSQGAVTIGGVQIPALTVRRAETTVELGSGQSFMIAGLMSNNSQNSVERTPGAADVPIIGALFKSTSYQKGETELVIVVTPYLVNPVDANDIKLPTDGLHSADIARQLLGNQLTNSKSGESRPMPQLKDSADAAPAVSIMSAPVQPSAAANAKPAKRKNGRTAASDTPAPGFNLQ